MTNHYYVRLSRYRNGDCHIAFIILDVSNKDAAQIFQELFDTAKENACKYSKIFQDASMHNSDLDVSLLKSES